MPPLPDVASLEKLTLVVVLAWGVIAFVMGWVIPKSVHDALKSDRDGWVARHDRIAQIAEFALRSKVGGGLP